MDVKVAPYVLNNDYYPLWAQSLWTMCNVSSVSRAIIIDALFDYAHTVLVDTGTDVDTEDMEAQVTRYSLKRILSVRMLDYADTFSDWMEDDPHMQSSNMAMKTIQSFFADIVLDDFGIASYAVSVTDTETPASMAAVSECKKLAIEDGVYDAVSALMDGELLSSAYYNLVVTAVIKLSNTDEYIRKFFDAMYSSCTPRMGASQLSESTDHTLQTDDGGLRDIAEKIKDRLNLFTGEDGIASTPEKVDDRDGYTYYMHRVFDYPHLVGVLADMRWDAETQEYSKSILKKASKSCGFKPGYILQNTDMVDQITDKLLLEFPHFRAIIDVVKRQMILSVVTQSAMHIPPILCTGTPGIGKTTFTHKLSQAVGLFHKVIHMETLTGGMVLAGSSTHWRGGHCGLFFDTMIESDVCNPMIILDELDKVAMYSPQDTIAPLYAVLEPSTSNKFIDEAVSSPMDMSLVNWIATANTPIDTMRNDLGEAILSRFTVFDISAPTLDEKRHIVTNMYANYIKDKRIEHIMSDSLKPDILDILTSGSLRDARKNIEDGCSNALAKVYKNLNHLTDSIHITQEDTSGVKRRNDRVKMGF